MTTLISTFSSIERNSTLITEYLNQIEYNIDIIKLLGQNTDSNGDSIDWINPSGEWEQVSSSINSILHQIANKGLGYFDTTNTHLFNFVINYYSEYNVQRSIVIKFIDFQQLLPTSNACIFGVNTSTDIDRNNLLNNLINELKNTLSIYSNLI